VDDSALNARTPLYASAPGGFLGQRILTSSEPTADVLLSDKYMQKLPDGRVLVDLDLPLNAEQQMKFNERVSDTPVYVKPGRTYRRYMHDAQKNADDSLSNVKSHGQVVRNAEGRVDDVGGVVLYPDGVGQPGMVFTTGFTKSPYTNALNRLRNEQYEPMNQIKRKWKAARKEFDTQLVDFLKTNNGVYDDDAFVRWLRNDWKRVGLFDHIASNNNLMHKATGNVLSSKDRNIMAANWIRSNAPYMTQFTR
jgi:hypothetical protein